MGPRAAGTISMDVAPDLKRILTIVPVDRSELVTLMIVQNWPQMLKTQ